MVLLSGIYKTYVFTDIHHFPPAKTDLYTYQNAKKPRFVDNMVDNVDKPWWITHAAFVNNVAAFPVFTHGKRVFLRPFLQEFLPENRACFCRLLA